MQSCIVTVTPGQALKEQLPWFTNCGQEKLATVGAAVGKSVGRAVGVFVGCSEGLADGESVGRLDGRNVGTNDGSLLGLGDGLVVALEVGAKEGFAVGLAVVDRAVGALVGALAYVAPVTLIVPPHALFPTHPCKIS